MKIVAIAENMHEMSKPDFWEKLEINISKCRLLIILHRLLGVK